MESRQDPEVPGVGQLWHAVLFFLTGSVVAQLLADRGLGYTPFAESSGLFDRAWPHFREPIRDAWTSYLDGRWDWDTACDRLAAGVHAER